MAGQVSASAPSRAAHLHWHQTKVGSDQELRGLDAVDGRTAWVSGDAGGVWLTTDAGRRWKDVAPPHSSKLLFRDLEATDAQHALLLAIGPKQASRIYRTTNGGRSWTKTFVNHDKRAFYDCMAMWPGGRDRAGRERPGQRQVPGHPDPPTAARSWKVLAARGHAEGDAASSASPPRAPAWSRPDTGEPGSPPVAAASRVFRTHEPRPHVDGTGLHDPGVGGRGHVRSLVPHHRGTGWRSAATSRSPRTAPDASAYTTDGGRSLDRRGRPRRLPLRSRLGRAGPRGGRSRSAPAAATSPATAGVSWTTLRQGLRLGAVRQGRRVLVVGLARAGGAPAPLGRHAVARLAGAAEVFEPAGPGRWS